MTPLRFRLIRRAAFLAACLTIPCLAAGGPTSGAGRTPAMETLADELVLRLGELSSEYPGNGLVALCLTSDGPREALVSMLLALLPDRLSEAGLDGPLHDACGPDGLSRAGSAGFSAHLEARVFTAGDSLMVAGVLRPTWVNFWTGRTSGEHHLLEVQVRMDRVTRILAGSGDRSGSPGSALVLREIAELVGRPIAIAVEDLTGDGKGEILVLLEDSLLVLAGDQSDLEELAVHDLSARPRALIASRDPAGGVVVASIGEKKVIAYHHSGLAEGEVLEFSGRGPLRPLTGLGEHPIAGWGGTVVYGRLLPGTNLFEGPLRVVGQQSSRRIDLAAPIVSVAIDPRRDLVWAVDHRFRLVDLSAGKEPPAPMGASGAALAFAELTLDGELNRVSTHVAPPSDEDRLVISSSWGEVLELRPVPGTIRALATGDVTGRGRDEIVVLSHTGSSARIFLLAEADR